MPSISNIRPQGTPIRNVQEATDTMLQRAHAASHRARENLDGLDREYYHAKAHGSLGTPYGQAVRKDRLRARVSVNSTLEHVRDLEAVVGTDLSLGGVFKEGAVRLGSLAYGVTLGLTWACLGATLDPLAKKFAKGSVAQGHLHYFVYSKCEEGSYAAMDRAFKKRSDGLYQKRLVASEQRSKRIKADILYPVPQQWSFSRLFRRPPARTDEEQGFLLDDVSSDASALVSWHED